MYICSMVVYVVAKHNQQQHGTVLGYQLFCPQVEEGTSLLPLGVYIFSLLLYWYVGEVSLDEVMIDGGATNNISFHRHVHIFTRFLRSQSSPSLDWDWN